MKNISRFSKDLENWYKELENRLIKMQSSVANKICSDVKDLAPGKTGEYVSSIKVGDTEAKNGLIKTMIYSDLTSGGYAVARMIENGTGIYALQPHIGKTKTFIESEYNYWFVPVKSVSRAIGRKIVINGNEFYIAYAQPPKPHFIPALNSNKEYYKKQIGEALKL